jgi:L-asparaginase II
VRSGIEESVHRGHVVEVGPDGRMLRVLGDPDRLVTLRSTVKPFGLLALIEAGGVEAFDLTAAELAIMASSHSGEDLHVRTLQALYRRAHISQAVLACGTEGSCSCADVAGWRWTVRSRARSATCSGHRSSWPVGCAVGPRATGTSPPSRLPAVVARPTPPP